MLFVLVRHNVTCQPWPQISSEMKFSVTGRDWSSSADEGATGLWTMLDVTEGRNWQQEKYIQVLKIIIIKHVCLCVFTPTIASACHRKGQERRQPLFSALRKPLQCCLESKIENGTLGAGVAKPTMAKMPLRLTWFSAWKSAHLVNYIYLVIELFAKLAMSLGKMGHYRLQRL